jgi:hypothetical protein
VTRTCPSSRCAGRPIASGASFGELDGIDHGWWVNSRQIVPDIEAFLTGLWKREEWNLVKTNRMLATVLFTDIADSTARLAEVGDARWRELVEQHHAVVRRQLVGYSGPDPGQNPSQPCPIIRLCAPGANREPAPGNQT